MPGKFAIGHNRYSTTGGTALRNVQPFFADTNAGGIGVAHNGNLTNAITIRNKLVEEGAIFYTTSDTEVIVQLIAKSKRSKTIDKIIDAIFQIQGGYALVMMTKSTLIGLRDPYGIRPLVIGKLKNSYVFASETCALDIIGAKFVRFPLCATPIPPALVSAKKGCIFLNILFPVVLYLLWPIA